MLMLEIHGCIQTLVGAWPSSYPCQRVLSVIAGVGPWAIDPFNRKMAD